MRTKTMALVAAFAAAGLGISLAADPGVYSLNVVGYVNAKLPPSTIGGGYALLCNPLSNGSNTLAEILPNPPLNTRVYRYLGVAGYDLATFEEDDFAVRSWGAKAGMVLAPGEGFWVRNNDNFTNTVTFVGEVVQGTTTNPIPAGFALRGSMVPQALPLWDPAISDHGTNDMNYPVTVNESRVYLFRDGYIICTFEENDDGDTVWSPITPTPQVGEGFWSKENTGRPWVRSFNVQ